MIVLLMLAHLIGDFFCQNTWLAKNKSKNMWALFLHVTIYTLVVSLSTLFLVNPTEYWLLFTLLTFFLHLVVDYSTSGLSSYYRDKDEHKFFCVIGTDQFVHFLCLYLTMGLL